MSDLLSTLTAPLFFVGSMPMSAGDMLGFATGLLCVWLTARAHIGNFPAGILNSAILGLVFLQQRLFADAGLQIVFIVLAVLGWRQWLLHGQRQATAPVLATSLREQLLLLASAGLITLLLWRLLLVLKGSAPPIDALITALSLCAQWQLNRRQTASWAWWIAVDIVSIPLYWSRGLPLIAALYAIFLLICLKGWWHWRSLAQARPLGAAA